MIDWKTIETEYVTTDISHRQLAEKYGIARSRISQYASKEKWREKRDKHRTKIVAKAVNVIGNKQAARAAKLFVASDLLLDNVINLLKGAGGHLADTSVMRDVSVVLKNLKDVQMIRSEADLREQEARIANLEKQAKDGQNDDNKPKIIVEGMPEEFKV